jgi:hypothetical protein
MYLWKIKWLRVCFQLILLIGIALVIAFGEVRLFQRRGLPSQAEYFFNIAEQIWRTGAMPRTAYYPPMIPLLIVGFRLLCIVLTPFTFNFCMLALGLGSLYGLSYCLLRAEKYAFVSVLLALLNPYFIWITLLSRDTGPEFLFLSTTLWIAIKVLNMPENAPRRQKYFAMVGLLGSAFLLSLSRVTGFFVVLTVIFLAVWRCATGWKRSFFAWCGGIFMVLTVLFCCYNYRLIGTFTLATHGGVNLYYGNHPAYIHGHPHYDIDMFMVNLPQIDYTPKNEGDLDQAYSRRGLEFILADPVSFVYRVMCKSVWHWLNLEKIPNYPKQSKIIAQTDTYWVIHAERQIALTPGVAYMLYKLIYLPLFLLSGFALVYRKIPAPYLLLYGPYLGLWPVLVLTFPDTRFKISAEILVIPALIAASFLWRRVHQAIQDM